MKSILGTCVKCGDEHAQITIDLPEGDVCATCVIEEIKRLRRDNEMLNSRLSKTVLVGPSVCCTPDAVWEASPGFCCTPPTKKAKP